MRVVADASPLILLARSELLSLLPTLLGTGGLLILAKSRGLIPSVADARQALRDSGLWLSDEMHRLLLQHAGESET